MPSALENSLRIKVTGTCNRNCFFCHQEGGMSGIEQIQYSAELAHIIDTCYQDLGLQSISITGGEPLLHPDLYDLLHHIYNNTHIKRFSLTTNGTIVKDFAYWDSLYKLGLYKVNISIPDILYEQEKLYGQTVEKSLFNNQISTIKILNKIGIIANINVVIFNDTLYTSNILSTLLMIQKEGVEFDIVLLPNLTNNSTFSYSQEIIKKIRTDMRLKKINSRRRLGTSNQVEEFISDNGNSLFVKTTKTSEGHPYFLSSLCDKCQHKKDCQEGFYGIRLEQVHGHYFIRLCICKSTTENVMPFEEFINSAVYRQLRAEWFK